MALLKRGKIYHVRAQVGGVMIAKSTKTANKRVAEQLEAKWISEVHTEVVVRNRRPITVQKAIEKFLEQRRGQAGCSSAEIKFRAFQPFYSQLLHEVKATELTKHAISLVEDEEYSVNTINVSVIYWNALQNFATKAGYTPGPKIKRLKGGSNRVRFLSDEEVELMRKVLDPHCGHFREKRKAQDNIDFFNFLLHTGAREQEVASMRLDQIDQAAGTILIKRSKGGTNTTLKMSKTLIEILARRMVEAEQPLKGEQLHGRIGNGFLFPERASGRSNNEWINKAAERAGLEDVSCHTLRHTFACKMLRSGMAITEVQYALGHKNLTSTMVYAHLIPTLVGDKVAEVFDK